MSTTSTNGTSNGTKRLNANSYISIGLMVVVVSSSWMIQKSITESSAAVIAKSDARYASRESLDAKWEAVNNRLIALDAAVNEIRVTVAGLPDTSAGMRDIQRQLDRIEKERK